MEDYFAPNQFSQEPEFPGQTPGRRGYDIPPESHTNKRNTADFYDHILLNIELEHEIDALLQVL